MEILFPVLIGCHLMSPYSHESKLLRAALAPKSSHMVTLGQPGFCRFGTPSVGRGRLGQWSWVFVCLSREMEVALRQ